MHIHPTVLENNPNMGNVPGLIQRVDQSKNAGAVLDPNAARHTQDMPEQCCEYAFHLQNQQAYTFILQDHLYGSLDPVVKTANNRVDVLMETRKRLLMFGISIHNPCFRCLS